jgi:hypothetical protein
LDPLATARALDRRALLHTPSSLFPTPSATSPPTSPIVPPSTSTWVSLPTLELDTMSLNALISSGPSSPRRRTPYPPDRRTSASGSPASPPVARSALAPYEGTSAGSAPSTRIPGSPTPPSTPQW